MARNDYEINQQSLCEQKCGKILVNTAGRKSMESDDNHS